MNIQFNREELDLLVEALNQRQNELNGGAAEVLPDLEAVNTLYNRLKELSEDHERGRDLSLEVFISDLASDLQIGVPKLHELIRKEVITLGRGSLDDGHWPTATESQRTAAIEHLGSKRLLIRFFLPDRPAIVKERDDQVKTPADRNREQDTGGDNEMDGQDALKLYNELVKSPQDRLALEKELPSLVAARDKAVTAAKREQLQKETAEIPGHVAKMRR